MEHFKHQNPGSIAKEIAHDVVDLFEDLQEQDNTKMQHRTVRITLELDIYEYPAVDVNPLHQLAENATIGLERWGHDDSYIAIYPESRDYIITNANLLNIE